MLVSDFDYSLPPELVAQTPPEKRGTSRMMVLARTGNDPPLHRSVADFPSFLKPGDLVVFNDTRVFAARAIGRWADTPGRVEVLFVEPSGDRPGAWTALCKSSRPMKSGRTVVLADGAMRATVLEKDSATGRVVFDVESDGDFFQLLEKTGAPPVPPYIKRTEGDGRIDIDRERYQTVYARHVGAVAAPTAGLHFSQELLRRIDETGARRAFVTLHVGPGTFRPVKTRDVESHVMDAERYEVPEETAEAWRETRARGARVFAVGSTSVRTLETACALGGGTVLAGGGRSSIFIHPPYRFAAVDAMLTNFHLPRSTLLMMVSAFAGRERVMAAYAEAIERQYRFYSYGDCMLML